MRTGVTKYRRRVCSTLSTGVGFGIRTTPGPADVRVEYEPYVRAVVVSQELSGPHGSVVASVPPSTLLILTSRRHSSTTPVGEILSSTMMVRDSRWPETKASFQGVSEL